MNSLIKENNELKERLADAVKELEGFKMQTSVWDGIARANKVLQNRNEKLENQLREHFNDGYNQAVWDINKFLTQKQIDNERTD